jgi:hypothetical protein
MPTRPIHDHQPSTITMQSLLILVFFVVAFIAYQSVRSSTRREPREWRVKRPSTAANEEIESPERPGVRFRLRDPGEP